MVLMLLCARLRERSAGVPTIGLRWEIRLWDKSSSSWDLGFSEWGGCPEVEERTLGEESEWKVKFWGCSRCRMNMSRIDPDHPCGKIEVKTAWTSSKSLISNDFKSVSPALAGQWDRWSGWSGCCRPWGWWGRAGWTRGCPRRSTWGWLLWGQEIILAMIPDERFWSELSMNFQPFQISWLENLLRYALTKCMYVGIYCKWTNHGEIFYNNRQYLSDRSKKNNWRARYQWTI